MLRLVCLNATFAHILPLSPLRLTPSFPKMLSLCRRIFIVRYSTKDFTVETLFWVSNEELLSDDGWLLNYIPYIDPEDKIIGFAQ